MRQAFFVAAILSCFTTSLWAQTPGPGAPAKQTATPPAKKPIPKAKNASEPPGPAESGPCRIGVISAIGDRFVIHKLGLTVFGNEETEVPISAWGLDDLVVARIRAAAPGTTVRKIAYARGAFDPWYHGRGKGLFNNPGENLTAVVRPVAANVGCDRYIVVTTFKGQLSGTNQALDGVGFSTNWSTGNKRGAVFAFVQVTVFDGQTFAIHTDPFATIGARLSASLSKDDNVRHLDNFELPNSPDEAVSNPVLRDGVRALLTEKLDRVMPTYLQN
jgi:hypothetical protein